MTDINKKSTSEFGKGLSYCLALFLCHSERMPMFDSKIIKSLNYTSDEGANRDAGLWFYAAGDHLYDLQIPNNLTDSLKNRLSKFSSKVIRWRMSLDNNQDMVKNKQWAIQEAKDLIRLIDKFHGVKTSKGQWE